MQPLNAANLLSIWERGRIASPGERALLLLAASEPAAEQHHQGEWTVGRRDAALLQLRAQLFGEQISGLTTCPQCSERLELDFSVNTILVPPAKDIPTTLSIATGEYDVLFRLPNAQDMAELERFRDDHALDRLLLQRCLLRAQQGGELCSAIELPQQIVDGIATQMAKADPQAEVELALDCPACGVQSQVLFDIVTFLWREIEVWALRTLSEVHIFASAYGWSEREILALSSWRRQFYLERIGV
jgi:hypothetical protein